MSAPSLPEYAPLPEKASLWEDCLDIFYAPRQVFERRTDGRFWFALVVYALLVAVLTFLGRQFFDTVGELAMERAMAERGMTAEQRAQMEQGRAMAQQFQAIGYIFFPVIAVVLGLVSGTVFWILSRLFGAALSLGQGLTIWTFAAYPSLVSTAVVVVQSFLFDVNAITHKHAFSINPARFLPADTNTLVMKLASLADPFAIWSGFLLGLGAHVIGKLERERAAVLGIIATLLYVLAFA